MKKLPIIALLSLLSMVCACTTFYGEPASIAAEPSASERSAAAAAFDTGINLALQGDVHAALSHLSSISVDALPEKKREALRLVLARFNSSTRKPVDGLDLWTRKVLDAYQHYWSRTMLGLVTREAGELELTNALTALLGEQPMIGRPVDMAWLEAKLKDQLSQRGLYALFGVTTPFREFILWRTQVEQSYPVDLPEGRENVPVVMLDNFASLGWAGFATGEYYHTGGWAKPDRLYCVRSAYDLESESFRVSYIAHEGQHFSDYRRIPALEQPELEYRAKLVEIAKAETTLHKLLKDFSANGSDSRDQPHGYADRRLIKDLARTLQVGEGQTGTWWETLPSAGIQGAAEKLLKEDTRRLEHAVVPTGLSVTRPVQ